MKWFARLVWPIRLSLLLTCVFGHAADTEGVFFTAPGSWVDVIPNSTEPHVREHPTGLAYEITDLQSNAGLAENYTHIGVRILSDAGRAKCGEIRFNFSPIYQTLTFHHVSIRRDGEVLDRLDPHKVKMLRRERSAEVGTYDGRMTALLILEDLRVGDLLDYAITIKGENPVFAGKFLCSWALQESSPCERLRLRLLFPEERLLYRVALGPKVNPPTISNHDGMTEWIWDRRNLPGVEFEGGAPAWYLQYPVLQVSEFSSWADVASWGRAVYPVDTPLPGDLEKMVLSLQRKPQNEAILAALHWVQREIRYLSLSLGESSFRPQLPAQVYAHRFGDCKDKALLLATLLLRLGYDAAPAFVDTSTGESLPKWLPSPVLFDHAIVHLRMGSTEYWLDPTRDYQAGELADQSVTDSHWALPLRVGVSALKEIVPTHRTDRHLETEENFTSKGLNQPIELEVRRTYHGAWAEMMRAFLANQTSELFGKDELNSYARMYPTIQLQEAPTWKDNIAQNGLTITEKFTISGFWKREGNQDIYRGAFIPFLLNELVDQPVNPRRTTPYDAGRPIRIDSRIRVVFDRDVQIQPVSWEEKTEAFEFRKQASYAKRRFEISYGYKTTAGTVAPDKMSLFAEQITKIRERIGYTVTLSDRTFGFAMNWPGLMVILMASAGGLYGAFRLSQSQPAIDRPPPLYQRHLSGLAGWLVLLGLNLCVGTAVSIYRLPALLKPTLDLTLWNAVTAPGSTAYHPAFAPVLLFESVYNSLRVVTMTLCLVLFFRRHHLFPRALIVLLGSIPLATFLDGLVVKLLHVGSAVGFSQNTITEIIRTVVYASVWIPYLLVSRRVKATFIR